ncbi:hypothetical protein LOAG_11586 [Loa loa]|uniref:Uncharacterized protein n=1 Tax=Loa loa TaxID=7209 RepID=A0A1I7V8R2_LOALO|nr:hypothetical protein LOAG_11586 [Loa loa]EFO16917.1 hypothetical protein LOAG_11586 [Loa loa]
MSIEDSNISDAPNPNPSSGDFLTETSAPVCINIPASNEDKTRNSEKDSESSLVGDTNPTERQNTDEAEHHDPECNPTATDDSAKADIPARGRSLKKESPTSHRDREISPRSLTGNAKVIALHKRLMARRRHPTPYPTKHRNHDDFNE